MSSNPVFVYLFLRTAESYYALYPWVLHDETKQKYPIYLSYLEMPASGKYQTLITKGVIRSMIRYVVQ